MSTSVSKKRGVREKEEGGDLKQGSLQERVHSILDTTAPSLEKSWHPFVGILATMLRELM